MVPWKPPKSHIVGRIYEPYYMVYLLLHRGPGSGRVIGVGARIGVLGGVLGAFQSIGHSQILEKKLNLRLYMASITMIQPLSSYCMPR